MTTATYRFQKRKFELAPYRDSWHEIEAFAGDRLVGRVVCFDAQDGDCWLHDLWVSPPHRGMRLGTKLLEQAIRTAQEKGYLRMVGELRAYDGNQDLEETARFFEHLGFRTDEGTAVGASLVVKMLM